MKSWIVALGAIMLIVLSAVPAGAKTGTYVDDGYPPKNLQGDLMMNGVVEFLHDVQIGCGKADPGTILEACSIESAPKLVLPNPCDPKFAGQSFARLTCHELGHLHGWPGNHPRPWPKHSP